eukprot:4427070-Pyramimonas_sp.AAC.1
MEEAVPSRAPPPALSWSRDVDRAVVVVNSRKPIRIRASCGAIAFAVQDAQFESKFKIDGEDAGREALRTSGRR